MPLFETYRETCVCGCELELQDPGEGKITRDVIADFVARHAGCLELYRARAGLVQISGEEELLAPLEFGSARPDADPLVDADLTDEQVEATRRASNVRLLEQSIVRHVHEHLSLRGRRNELWAMLKELGPDGVAYIRFGSSCSGIPDKDQSPFLTNADVEALHAVRRLGGPRSVWGLLSVIQDASAAEEPTASGAAG